MESTTFKECRLKKRGNNHDHTSKPKDFDAFLAALDTSVKPNTALSRVFERLTGQVGRQ